MSLRSFCHRVFSSVSRYGHFALCMLHCALFWGVGVSVQADDYLDDVYYWDTIDTLSDEYTADSQANTEQVDDAEEETPELLLYTYRTDAYDPGEFTHAVVIFVEDSTLNQATQVRAIIRRY